jgi:wyosine [tRNA(Phe)-imidazoG37] synthetase (radical SAM superfamily)
MTKPIPDPVRGHPLFQSHPRSFARNRYVYAVLSRRSAGISIGVNLNLDKVCNFGCVYCQVDRTEPTEPEENQLVDLDQLSSELEQLVEMVTSGRIYEQTKFRSTPEPLRRLNDIAFSGDAEPTMYRHFEDVVAACAEVRRRQGIDDVKLVLITNASMFHRERVQRALRLLDANNGEIWAKLDAGSEAGYRRIARSAIPWSQILTNLRQAAIVRPIVIQSLLLRDHGEPPAVAEQEAYCQRLSEIIAGGGQIKLVQIYTVARAPAESWVSPLQDSEVDALVELVRRRTGLPVAGFYSGSG